MALVSFAQNQEDIMLWRALQNVRNGFYIDVGAADPVEWSVTKLFYDQGWCGINLEPQPEYFASLSKARPHDTNLRIAAGREAGSRTFHRIDKSGLSTFDADIAAGHRANGWDIVDEVVEVLTLAEICQRYRPHGPIHFLKIDVEGSEGDVLAGADFRSFRPWIVVVEATLPMSQTESYADWEPVLLLQGYGFVWFDGLNRFYLADEMRDELGQYFHTQPNVFDGFEPAFHLLQRAERSEEDLQQARTEIAQTARTAAETVRDAAETFQRTATTGERSAEAVRCVAEAVQQTAATLAQQTTLLFETQRLNAELAQHRDTIARQLADLQAQCAALSNECEQQREAVLESQRQTAATLAQQTTLLVETQRQNAELVQHRETLAHQLAEAQAQCAALSNEREQLREAVLESQRQTAATLARQTNLLAETQRQKAELIQYRDTLAHQLADAKAQCAALSRERAQLREAVSESQRRQQESLTSLESAREAARQAEELLLRTRRSRNTKERARRVFHRGAVLFLRLPGGRRGMRLVYAMAPRPVEWLAQRYRAYEQSALERRGAAAPASLPHATPADEQPIEQTADLFQPVLVEKTVMLAPDLSREEARTCCQLVAWGLTVQ
jgi:FkbM family methyltransferase